MTEERSSPVCDVVVFTTTPPSQTPRSPEGCAMIDEGARWRLDSATYASTVPLMALLCTNSANMNANPRKVEPDITLYRDKGKEYAIRGKKGSRLI
ncbi:hypothetical protein GWI33_011737 [Rhynchophorus ferrugineus]|uniref:Uncharacterized protein n=1 Tax=Rhynchophorus ferrugineus TaxID=354439 RepID=A0A834ICD4_RHYFE|nr:hypothetical protein GWI33_011737 [Rhynchophorus ferrugineus]